MSKPILLLDIDGVINSFCKAPVTHVWPKVAWKTDLYSTPNMDEYPLMWSQPVVDYLGGLGDRVEVRWHSSWQQTAPEFGKLVGLPDYQVQECPEFTANSGLFAKQQILARKPNWWKYPAVERVLAQGRPVIWADDEILSRLGRHSREQLKLQGELLLLCPDEQTGLTRKHLRLIEEFVLDSEEAKGAVTSC